VERLRERLAAEGYGDAKGPANYDRALAGEVAEFQVRHELRPTGNLDAATTAAMNVPAATRLWSLAANLERERWLPDQLPPERIEANIGAQEVVLFENDKPVLEMRSIVGEPTKPTPLFVSHVSSIEFNPAWHVPADIAKAELLPKGHGYLSSHGYSLVDGQLVQHAGPRSSLGRVKFEMPNPFSVYLHDTPGRSLFAVDSRGRSHGCVRLEKPNDLAVALLSDQGWTLDKVNDTIAAGDTRWVRPKTNMPVYLFYRTAEAPDDGPAIFRPDLYGWDGKLAQALIAAAR
jgi:murein L,D-transpeptidase YcbB/YkuD